MTDAQQWDTDQGPDHPDLQHEQPPVEATNDAADKLLPGEDEDDPGELPPDIPDPPEEE